MIKSLRSNSMSSTKFVHLLYSGLLCLDQCVLQHVWKAGEDPNNPLFFQFCYNLGSKTGFFDVVLSVSYTKILAY